MNVDVIEMERLEVLLSLWSIENVKQQCLSLKRIGRLLPLSFIHIGFGPVGVEVVPSYTGCKHRLWA